MPVELECESSTYGVRRFAAAEPFDVDGTSYTGYPVTKIDSLDKGTTNFIVMQRVGHSFGFTNWVIYRRADWPHTASGVAPGPTGGLERFPHRCPYCHQASYNGLLSIEHRDPGAKPCIIA